MRTRTLLALAPRIVAVYTDLMTADTNTPSFRVRYTDDFGKSWDGYTVHSGSDAREDARKEARYARSCIPYNVYRDGYRTVCGVCVVPA